MTMQSFVGMWVTADGYIRHELLPNGRYDEARGSKRRTWAKIDGERHYSKS